MGSIRFAKIREVKGRIVQATVRRNPSGKYFVLLLVETKVQKLSKTNSFQSLEENLAEVQRVLSRRTKGFFSGINNK